MESNAFLHLEPADYNLTPEHCADIELLDRLLGEILAEHAGRPLIDLARRMFAWASTSKPGEGGDPFASLDDPAAARSLLRAYTVLFQLMNLIEQKEIVRVNLERQRAAGSAPRNESLLDVITRLKKSGVTADQMQALFNRLDIVPTLTAHPTESRRRAILDKLEAVANLLVERSHPDGLINMDQPLTRKDHIESELMRYLGALWLTEEFGRDEVTVSDEVRNAVYFIEHTIFDLVPCLYRDLYDALAREYPGVEFNIPAFWQYRSWVGGDRDGNPNVTPERTWEALVYHKKVAIRLYIRRIGELLKELTQSASLSPAGEELMESLRDDYEHLKLPRVSREKIESEPYACKLRFIRARLYATLRHMRHCQRFACRNADPEPPGVAYTDSRALLGDLELVRRGLLCGEASAVRDAGSLGDLIVQVKTFGFHLCTLDMRQHSEAHESALDEIFAQARLISDGKAYSDLSEDEKVELLTNEFYNPRPLLMREAPLSDQTRRVLDVFEVMRRAKALLSTRAVSSYVISMTHTVSDVLEVLVLAKEAGLIRWRVIDGEYQFVSGLDVSPLFETIDDLERADGYMKTLFANRAYELQLKARGWFQEIMLGYSDSSKDGGYMAANWYLYSAQERLADACRQAGVEMRLFHGRGGTVGRGGGRAYMAIRSQPSNSLQGRIRFTEQGEVISFRYSFFSIAHRHLEQIAGAVLMAASDCESFVDPPAEWKDAMAAMAEHSRHEYRDLIYDDPEFWPFFTQATPIEFIRHLSIASRPVSRKGGSSMKMDDLRAIPWVFSWMQSRYLVPGWYGLGTALEWFAGQGENQRRMLDDMYRQWPFFALILNNAHVELLRAHLPTASWYAAKVAPGDLGERVHQRIQAEYDRTDRWIAEVSGSESMYRHRNAVQRTIRFRNPIVAPINQMQVELMRRCRELEENDPESGAWTEALLLSIAGIAAAMQSTG
ncbi:MAG: phosphoenolpyruvate carboxylase [bacterium]|nr:phosphoenolpyruvate carboxylase [bacterium]